MEEYIADLQEQLITAQHRFMKMHRDLCFTGLRKSEFVMLEIIERENGNREQGVLASDIAKRLRITAPAVSKMLRSMEEKGYVERRVDEKDRRNTRVSITPDGKEAERKRGCTCPVEFPEVYDRRERKLGWLCCTQRESVL